MERRLKVVIQGLGKLGQQCTKLLLSRHVDVVGAVDGYDRIIGKDLGEILDEENLKIKIESDLNKVLKREKPDIVVQCSKTSLEDIANDIKICIENKVNLITASEEAYFWRINHFNLGKELDDLAKKSGVTICAGGVQDIQWGILPASLSATCHQISEIEGNCVVLINDNEQEVKNGYVIGWSVDEFQEYVDSCGKLPLDPFAVALYCLTEKLKLHPKYVENCLKPVISKKDIFCKGLNRTILKGQVIGSIFETHIQTKEGIVMRCSFINKFREKSDTSYNQWNIKGVPDMFLKVEDVQGNITTSSSIVNRITDVINAKPGFLTINELDVPFFKLHPLNEYIR